MPGGNTSIQPYTPTVYTAQVASAYKSNIDGNSSILGNPAGSLNVYPNNPAGLSVLVDPAFNLWSGGGGGTNAGPILFNTAASPATVSLTAPGANSYYATIYWNPNTNAAGVVYGVASAAPFPILPDDASFIPLACVLIATGQSQVQANNIFDIRSFWTFGPLRYANLSFAANTTVNCAGATSINLEIGITTAGFTLTLANVRVGIPVQIVGRPGAPTLTFAWTTPGGVAYTLQTKQGGAAAAWASMNPFSIGAGVGYNWGPAYTYYHSGTPYWNAPFL